MSGVIGLEMRIERMSLALENYTGQYARQMFWSEMRMIAMEKMDRTIRQARSQPTKFERKKPTVRYIEGYLQFLMAYELIRGRRKR